MNEITKIHLGRQPFNISVEAHKILQEYLAAIKKLVSKEVLEEVEIRMSELLGEHGVTGEKVIVAKDIAFIKSQLGEPEDFTDEPEVGDTKATAPVAKRLFRDTGNGILAGVSSGISNYIGLDVAVVRVIFVLLSIFGGGVGILLYLLLWLVVPPAITASEKLQMSGKPVTLEGLKETVNNQAVKDTANKIGSTLSTFINSVFKLGLKLIAAAFTLAGVVSVFAMAVIRGYMALHDGKLFQENIFPIGTKEHWLVYLVMIVTVLVAVFLALVGVTIFKRKWPLKSWTTATLVGLIMFTFVGVVVLTADAAPRVEERYQTIHHVTRIDNIQPFTQVDTTGRIDISYIASPDYEVSVNYVGNPDFTKVKFDVKDGVLHIDSTELDKTSPCTMLCLFPRYNMDVTIYAPNIEKFITPPGTEKFFPSAPAKKLLLDQ